jgi:hypothetical protein
MDHQASPDTDTQMVLMTFKGTLLPLFDWQGKGRLSMHSCPVVPLLVAIVLD